MPLVVPNTNSGDDTTEWQNKLVGKTISEEESNETMFCKRDLPQQTRVLKPGAITTRDYREDRLNVHTDDDGIVTHVTKG